MEQVGGRASTPAKLFSNAPGFIAIVQGPDHRWVFANRRFEQHFPGRAIVGEPAAVTFPALADQGFLAVLDQVYQSGERFIGERVRLLVATEGQEEQEVFVSVVVEPIADPEGQVTGIFISGFDLSPQVQAETALLAREARYRTLFNSVDQGFCILEMIFDQAGAPVDYRFLETNATFEQQTGLVDAVGRTARELVPNLEQFWFETYGQVAKTGVAQRFRNGSAEMGRWFDVYAVRVGGHGSNEVALLFTDITAQQAAEEERDRLLSAAEAAVESRDTLLSITAHELKNPLTAIKGGAQLLLRRQRQGQLASERLTEGLESIIGLVNRLVDLTDDLLDMSRLRTGQLPLKLQELDLGVLAQEVVAQMQVRARSTHTLTLTVAEGVPLVQADQQRVTQVLTNLLENALKYSPDGGAVQVRVTGQGAGVAVAVQDSGIGLPAGAARQIFEPFQRAQNATERALPGVGLGLYICCSIVERHGGWIRAQSDGEGAGTTMTFWLPCAGPSLADAADEAAAQ